MLWAEASAHNFPGPAIAGPELDIVLDAASAAVRFVPPVAINSVFNKAGRGSIEQKAAFWRSAGRLNG